MSLAWRHPIRSGRDLAARVEAHWERVRGSRNEVPALDAAFGVAERDAAVAGSLLAGALAYRLFLWLLPAALVAYAGLGFAAADGSAAAAEATEAAAGLREVTAGSIEQAATDAHRSRWSALIIGLVLLYLASSHLLSALKTVSALAWQSPVVRSGRTPVASLLVVVFAVSVVGVNAGAGALRRDGGAEGLLVLAFLIVVWAALWWVASWLLPHGQASGVHLLPGALLFGIGIQILYVATAVYFTRKIASASELYGTLGAAATLLLWLFLLARLIVAAAAVNAVLWQQGAVHHLLERAKFPR